LPTDGRKRETPPPRVVPRKTEPDVDRSAIALKVWGEGVDPRGTLVERYLAGRKLELGADVAGEVLRWHPGIGAMMALFRNIATDAPQAVSRTFLDPEGHKRDRKFLGPVAAAAIKLDSDEDVLGGLHIGEGVSRRRCRRCGNGGERPSGPNLPGKRLSPLFFFFAEHRT
jgi:hypothetical protein